MKSALTLFCLIAICTAARPAQQAPSAPTAPAILPTPPAPAAMRSPLNQSERQLKEASEHLKKVAEAAKTKFDWVDWAVFDPFNERDDPNRTLIISQAPGEASHQADTREDLEVMSHILQKASASRDERTARSVGITFRSPFGSSPALRNLYLEGYGAVFFLNVSYSLIPPAVKPGESEPKPGRDSEWEAARRELSQPGASRSEDALGPGQDDRESGTRSAPPYDADKVESLKKNLAEALKNAVHIRQLQPDESVTIVVAGRSPWAMKPAKVRPGRRPDASDNSSAARERLILRAKKSDIQDFEAGKTSLEDFRQKVTAFFG